MKKVLIARMPVPANVFEYLMGYIPSQCTNKYITNVNYYEMMMFCNKLSEYRGLTPVYSIDGTTDVSKWGLAQSNNYTTSKTVVTNSKANGYMIPEYNLMADAKNKYKDLVFVKVFDRYGGSDYFYESYVQGKQYCKAKYYQSSPEGSDLTCSMDDCTFRVMRNK